MNYELLLKLIMIHRINTHIYLLLEDNENDGGHLFHSLLCYLAFLEFNCLQTKGLDQ
jgi:hypothetical protein